MDTSKSPLVIYHANCMDGFAAAWCFWASQKRLGMTFDFHPGIYGEQEPDCADREVYLVDFSYSYPVMDAICQVAKKVYLIDHHKTAINALLTGIPGEDLQDKYPGKFLPFCSIDCSGAHLAWIFCNRGTVFPVNVGATVPKMILHVEDRDLWQFKMEGTREICAAIFSYEYSFDIYDMLMNADGELRQQLLIAGTAINRKFDKDLKELLNVTRRIINFQEYTIPIANLPYTFASDAGSIMAKEWKEGSLFAATYYDTTDSRVFSLRSVAGGVDVSRVAERFGGGGHARAAGFRVGRFHILASF